MPTIIRAARLCDVPGMTEIFFRAFTDKFWQHFCPDTEANRAFIGDMWTRGIKTPTDRSFVVFDANDRDTVIGVSRWQLPQPAGGQNEDAWPKPDVLDQSIAVPFFNGMEVNRSLVMKDKPHWYLDMLAVDSDHQGKGIAKDLIDWGIQQADKSNLSVFLHGTEAAQSFYVEKYDFKRSMKVAVPDRPEYGSYDYDSMIREPRG